MRFPTLPILFVAMSLGGCAQQKLVLPAGEDTVSLEAAIANRGSGAPQADADVPHRNVIGPVLQTGAKLGETCAVIGTAVAYAKAKANPDRAQPREECNGAGESGVSDRLHKIWSDE